MKKYLGFGFIIFLVLITSILAYLTTRENNYAPDDSEASEIKTLSDLKILSNSEVVGYARHYFTKKTACKSITGWASNSSFNLNISSVKIFDNDILIGDVQADRFWDNTVGNHGFLFNYHFSNGSHIVTVMAEDPTSIDGHIQLIDSPISFDCPAQDFDWDSWLSEDSCIENTGFKICFDDLWGGVVSGLYSKKYLNQQNLIFPTAGGALQVDLRSNDPINACQGKNITWGKVWNPTQAGCENCYMNNSTTYNVPSFTSNKILTNDIYAIDIRPRNYYHHNNNDCGPNTPYTEVGIEAEDIYMKQTVITPNETIFMSWDIEHRGQHTHLMGNYNHELPTFYTNDTSDCFVIDFMNTNNQIETKPLPCKTGSYYFIDALNGWVTVRNPNNSNERYTLVSNTSIIDNSITKIGIRNYYSTSNGNQITFLNNFSITPGMKFTTKLYILPYAWNEYMDSNGTQTLDYIKKIQTSNVTGYARHFKNSPSTCKKIRGWASNSSFTTDVDSVIFYDNNNLIGEARANEYWDKIVQNHGYTFNYNFEPGHHKVVVLAKDPFTLNYSKLIDKVDAPLEFDCP